MSFGQKSVGQTSLSWYVMVMSVGKNVRTGNVAINLVDGS